MLKWQCFKCNDLNFPISPTDWFCLWNWLLHTLQHKCCKWQGLIAAPPTDIEYKQLKNRWVSNIHAEGCQSSTSNSVTNATGFDNCICDIQGESYLQYLSRKTSLGVKSFFSLVTPPTARLLPRKAVTGKNIIHHCVGYNATGKKAVLWCAVKLIRLSICQDFWSSASLA